LIRDITKELNRLEEQYEAIESGFIFLQKVKRLLREDFAHLMETL